MDDNLRWLSENMSASIVTITGSTSLLGNLIVSYGITGSLFGTSSWAVSASWAPSSTAITSISSSYVSGSGAIVTNLTSSNDASINGITVGRGAFSSNTNTAFGLLALSSNSSGLYNTAIGHQTLRLLTSGILNTANGFRVLNSLTTGNFNTSFGSQNLQALTIGTYNTVIGASNANTLIDGSFNTIIGSQIAGLSSTLNNNIILADGQGNIKYRWDGIQNTISGGVNVTGGSITGSNALFTGVITAQTLVVQTITASTEWITGSSKFGSLVTDTHQFTGSILAASITGSLFGTSSWAISSSYTINAISSSYVSGSGAIVTNLTSSNNALINGITVGKGGNQSTIIGEGAKNASFGVSIGYSALANTTGNGNTAVGRFSLTNNTTGFDNIGIGSNALITNTTGVQNTVVGSLALSSINGSWNTAIGNNALNTLQLGDYNIAIGRLISSGLITGSYNTIIGSQITGLLSTLNNNIILADGEGNIKYRWDATQNNIYGNLALTGSMNITGSLTSSQDARINGLRVGRGNNNQIENTVVGDLAFVSNQTGIRNTAVGFETLYSNTTGRYNTAYGMDALYYNSVGQENVAIGYAALQSNRSGSFNTILGGSLTAYEITSGSYNTILGTNSGRSITIGNNNTIIGGRLNNTFTPGAPFTTTMSDNVILGDGKGYIRYRFDGTQNNFYDNTVVTGSLIATQGFTGSLLGTASWANNAITSSYALNGGVTQLLAGSNIILSPTNGLGQVTITSTGGGGPFFNTSTGSYGSFYSTQTQTNVASTARSMSLNVTDITNGVSVSGSTDPFNTYIKIQNTGVYNIQFSAQVDKTDAGTDEIWIWVRKNGTNLTDTATSIQLVGNGAHYVAAWNFFVNALAGDYFQLMWYSTDANVRLHAEPAFGVVPGIPSLIVTANRVDQFLSNTGSFSGSFTGLLFGTASWAVSASWAPNSGLTGGQTNYVTKWASSTTLTTGSIYDSASLVGIGTIAPSYKLHIADSAFPAVGIFRDIDVVSVGPAGQIIEIGARSGSNFIPAVSIIGGLDNPGSSGNLTFQTRTANVLTSKMFISASGNVGIGTTAPKARLEVNGSVIITGSLNLTQGVTGSLFGTASWANNAITSSYPISVTGSNMYSVSPLANVPNALVAQNNIFLGLGAGTSSNNGIESNFIGYYAGGESTASYSNFIGSYAGSYATNALTSNFIGTSAGYGATNAADSVFIGSIAGGYAIGAGASNFIGSGAGSSASSASYSNFIGYLAGGSATNASQSNFIGTSAGYFARNSSDSNFIGTNAGSFAISAFNSNFIGASAGAGANSASYSNFIGQETGLSAAFSKFSNFIGYNSGYYAISASYSNFIGFQSGIYAPSASFCTLIGYRAGSSYSGYGLASTKGIGSNNIIIGNFITLPEGTRDSINLGGIIFATGSYFNPDPMAIPQIYPLSGSANGKVGINKVSPSQELDVSGSVQISQLLILPPQHPLPITAPIASIASSGSGVNCKPYFWNGTTWTSMI